MCDGPVEADDFVFLRRIRKIPGYDYWVIDVGIDE